MVAAVVVVVLVTGGSDRSSPESLAQAAVDTFNDQGPGGVASLACADARGRTEWTADLTGAVAEVRDVTMDGELRATAELRFTDPADGLHVDMRMTLSEEDDRWCVSSFEGWTT